MAALAYSTPSHTVPEPPVPASVYRRLTVSIVVPALNEAENLPHILPRIPTWVHEVLLVDGRSTDDTIAVACAVLPTVRIITQDGRGKGAALRSGVAAATGDIIVLLDADGSTDPEEIPYFVGTLIAGADYAKGSRFLHSAGTDDMPLYRQLGNQALVTLTNILFSTRYTDITYGYNAFWRSCSDALALDIDGWACEIVGNIRVARHGLRVIEVASHEHRRIAGEAKLEAFSAGWTILQAILREFFAKVTTPRIQVPRRAVHLEAFVGHHEEPLTYLRYAAPTFTFSQMLDREAPAPRERVVGESY